MKQFYIAVLLLCFGTIAQAAPRPNIVYILADDLGYGDVQCMNPERSQIPTPHMDQLAADGMIFTDVHSSSSVCTPTRYGILTGRYNWRTRLQKHVLYGFSAPLLADDRLTVAELLKAQGYHTAAIGKWQLGLGIPTTNLYNSHPEIANRLLQQLESDVVRGRSTAGVDLNNDVDIVLWKEKALAQMNNL
ncbi:sulfatase-like hydrolase/transferase [Coraliomargarita sp. SDUM461004]|uniref:Sulfatase-like hydrolase/transferase n=1 Tax=Thalassobacterium sedimentorum TaxID=3041258 RepID=A0ABU1ALH0_9BACT|nr:sulfatase-like hydrolase/transferase [Coraliomargarita sp. SDUM461004]MDQ8195631.1 sulfatase-like hydrolase/transferase [Coraliomargarita sp. SDUM461004]